MTKSNIKYKLVFWGFLLIVAICMFCSCSSIKKLSKSLKQTEQVKTTEQSNKTVDSSTTTITKKIDSSGTTVTVVFDNDGKDTATNIEITTYPPHKEDYFNDRKVGVKTNRTPKSITVNQADKKADEQAVATNVKTTDTKATTTEKKMVRKEKMKDVEKTRFQWWVIIFPMLIVLMILLTLWGAFGITPITLWKRIKSFFTKNNNMKNLILLLAVSCMLFIGCDAPEKNKVEERTSLMRPDVDHDWEIQMVDTTGKFAYQGFNEKGQGVWLTKDSTWKKQKKIARSTFWITMSEKMVKKFMVLTDYFTKDLLLATVLLIVLAILITLFIKGDWMRFMGKGGALGFILVVYIGTTIRVVQKRPTELAGNNVKQLSRAEYDYWMKRDSTFEKFWLEKWERNELMTLTNKNTAR